MKLEDFPMWHKHLDLFGVILLAGLVLWVTMSDIESVWLRSLLSLPLALYGVGYALGSAIYPQPSLGAPERFLLSLGLSLASLILSGLLLHLDPAGLTPLTWALMLFLITIGAATLASSRRWLEDQFGDNPAHRRKLLREAIAQLSLTKLNQAMSQQPSSQQSKPRPPGTNLGTVVKQNLSSAGRAVSDLGAHIRAGMGSIVLAAKQKGNLVLVLMLGLSAFLIAFSASMAARPAPQTAYQGYSMLWIAPVPAGAPEQIEVGVRSMEFEDKVYRIELHAGGGLVDHWDDIHLDPKQEWTVRLDLRDYQHLPGPLEAHLYQIDRPGKLYRQVHLWPQGGPNTSIVEGQ
jgi:hypothetical protein